jgi:hypothetical protein
MDVRLSPEQVALRDSVAHVVDRLGPQAVGELDDRERAGKLDAAVVSSGWRELRTAADDGAPWATGVEVALVAEELGRGLADAAYLGPTLAAELRRLAGAPPASAAETVALTADMTTLACLPGATAGTTVAVDADSAAAALALAPAPGGHTLVQVALAAAKGAAGGAATSSDPVDLTRRSVAIDPSAAVTPVSDQTRVLPEEDETRWTGGGGGRPRRPRLPAPRRAGGRAGRERPPRRQDGRASGG